MKTALAFATLFGLTTLTGCGEDEPENFGTIRIEISPQGGDTNITANTTEIVATVQYEACLQDFYLNRQPNHRQDGVDGAPVFEEWAARLCSDFDDIPDCEVTSIEQSLLENNDIYTLKITYKILDASTIPYRDIHLGPIPVKEFAGCSGNELPLVELAQTGLIGRDAQGTQIWRVSSLPAANVAVANQGAPLRVEVVLSNPNP